MLACVCRLFVVFDVCCCLMRACVGVACLFLLLDVCGCWLVCLFVTLCVCLLFWFAIVVVMGVSVVA